MKKFLSCCVFALSLFALCGCWDVQDITNRAYITSIGLDQGVKETTDNYRVTFEIVLPSELREQDERKANFIHTVEAASIGTAVEKLQGRISHPLNLGHLRVLVIGGKFAGQKNFLDVADFFQRNPNIQKRIKVLFIEDGDASEILRLNPLYEKYIAKELVAMSELNLALVRRTSFFDFLSQLREHDGTGFGTRALIDEKDNKVLREGGAIFKNWRLIGWLTSEETIHANWITGRERFVVDAKRKESTYTYLVDTKSIKITPVQKDGIMGFNVKLKTAGSLMQEQGDHIDASDLNALQQLEELFARTIKRQVESAIEKAQKDFGVDYLGFDTALKQTNPEKFEQSNWQEIFPEIPIAVDVDAKITRFGLSK